MDEKLKVTERVKKMLALANDAGAAEGERDNAMRMAHKLMAKYNIDSLTLENSGGVLKEKRIEFSADFYGRPWARNVAHNVTRLFFCSYIFRSHRESKLATHSFLGRESNSTTAAEIARFVVESIFKEGNRNKRAAFEGNDFFRSFCWGAASEVRSRVNQLIKEATQPSVETSSSTALVLLNHYAAEEVENTALVATLYPKLRSSRQGKGIGSHSAMAAGREFGKSLNLNRQVSDTRTKGQLN